MRKSVLMLAGAGVAVGVMSEILVGSITEASESIGLSPFFVGIIVVAIVGNAAEHWVAIYFAARDKMDLAVNIAIGSSAQIALFAAPVLVLLSLFVGDFPMALVFNGFELGAVVLAVLIALAGDAGGRVDVVRGPPAARGVRGAGPHLLLRLMAVPVRVLLRPAAVGSSSPRPRSSSSGSTCTSSRAGASRASARA